MLSNSSSGLIEAIYFNLPVINVGIRQEGRDFTSNVIHSHAESESIVNIVNEITERKSKESLDFVSKVPKIKSSEEIINFMKNIKDKPQTKTFYKLRI